MKRTGGDVDHFLASVKSGKRRRDAATMAALMRDVTGREPELWGTIVGFGACHYKYPTGTEGDMPIVAFAPRAQATTVYLLDAGAYAPELAKLGPHEIGASCLYLKDLEQVDADVLRGIIAEDYRRTITGETGDVDLTIID
jgi:hypothetical protein